jgi:hypothetical protein
MEADRRDCLCEDPALDAGDVPARRSGATARRRGNLMRLLHFVRNDTLTDSQFIITFLEAKKERRVSKWKGGRKEFLFWQWYFYLE